MPHETGLDDSERTRCEVWTRVMGYHRPVTAWNRGKQQEHLDRQQFREASATIQPYPTRAQDCHAHAAP